ncbi:hypothetical protein V1477_011065 [Vespula maculifrons]|uniref:Uncharacterized protein n=1 Tax=Vespula maculifrons TaxID=7453 RepID=A0ABD2C3Q4_VESMC
MRYGSKGNVRKFRRKRRLIQDEKERHIDSCCRRTYVDRTAGRRLARKVGKGNGRREGVGWLEGTVADEEGDGGGSDGSDAGGSSSRSSSSRRSRSSSSSSSSSDWGVEGLEEEGSRREMEENGGSLEDALLLPLTTAVTATATATATTTATATATAIALENGGGGGEGWQGLGRGTMGESTLVVFVRYVRRQPRVLESVRVLCSSYGSSSGSYASSSDGGATAAAAAATAAGVGGGWS